MNTKQNKKTYRAVVFDHDGVLEFFGNTNPIILASETMGVPVDEFRNVYFKYNHLSNTGNMPWSKMFAKVISAFDDTEETKNRVMEIVEQNRDKCTQNTELFSILPKLKTQGLKLAVFSNNTSSIRTKLTKNGIAHYFDEIVLSGEIGFQKPQQGAFDVLFSKLNVQPNEVIFIDDSEQILETSSEIGYTPILFKSNQQLFTDLENLGIKI